MRKRIVVSLLFYLFAPGVFSQECAKKSIEEIINDNDCMEEIFKGNNRSLQREVLSRLLEERTQEDQDRIEEGYIYDPEEIALFNDEQRLQSFTSHFSKSVPDSFSWSEDSYIRLEGKKNELSFFITREYESKLEGSGGIVRKQDRGLLSYYCPGIEIYHDGTEAHFDYAIKKSCRDNISELKNENSYSINYGGRGKGDRYISKAIDYIKKSIFSDGPSFLAFTSHKDFEVFIEAGNSDQKIYRQSTFQKRGTIITLVIGWNDDKQAWLCKGWLIIKEENAGTYTFQIENSKTFWIAYKGHANNLNFYMANIAETVRKEEGAVLGLSYDMNEEPLAFKNVTD